VTDNGYQTGPRIFYRSIQKIKLTRTRSIVVRFDLALVGGRVECVSLGLEPRPSSRGLGTADLRSIPLQTIVGDARVDLYEKARLYAQSDEPFPGWQPLEGLTWSETRDGLRELLPVLRSESKRRARRGARVDLAQVASVYEAAQRQGLSAVSAVEQAFELTPSGAKKRIRRAREEGFLEATTGRTLRSATKRTNRMKGAKG